ncbi:MAG TPA: CocE/NonD family hydrolase [Solirubrobacter sp.]
MTSVVPARASRREALSFRVSLAVIAVAVADDAFAHREPGTAVSDHLVSGLVPLAVAGAIAWAYPRLRASARAGVAIVCGVLAVVAGVSDGLRHVLVDRVSGDDATVMLAGLVGLALVAGGVALLWRARRTDGHRWARRPALAVATALATLFVVLPVCVAIVATHKARSPVGTTLGQRVTLRTADGLALAASYAPSRNGAAVIVFPGRTPATLRHARLLTDHGYGVLTLDRRGEGESQGELNLFGYNGEGDVREALDFLSRRPDVEGGRIAGLGLSVGGELLLQTAAHDQRLRAVVSEGAGVRSLAEHLHTPGVGRVQRWATNWLAQTAAVAILSGTAPPEDLAGLVQRIGPRPVLLIRAANGHPDERLNTVYAERIGASATQWLAPGGHTLALEADPVGYERQVIGFLDEALRPRPRA